MSAGVFKKVKVKLADLWGIQTTPKTNFWPRKI